MTLDSHLKPKRIESDNHNHILAAPIESMVNAARRKGVKRFSITEHVSQFGAARDAIHFTSVHSSGRMFQDLREYLAEFDKVDRAEGFQLRRGLEVDYIAKYQKEIGQFVGREKWDLLLCSVHELSNGRDIEAKLGHDQDAMKARWREYVRTQIEALESDYVPFDVLTHPVRLFRGARSFPSEEIDVLLEDLARTARHKSKALELNASDMDTSPKLVERLARAAGAAGCKVSFGSDAHSPDLVFEKAEYAARLVEEFRLELKF